MPSVESVAAPDDFNYNALFELDDAPVEAAPSPAPVAAPPEVVPQEPQAPPAGAEPPQQAQVEPAAVQPATVQSQVQQGASPPPSPADLGAIAALLVQHEDEAVRHIAETSFKLSSEEIEALETDAVGTIPKLMARAFVKAQQNILALLAKSIPLILANDRTTTKASSEAENAFFSRWPDIKKDQHGELVYRLGTTYRQANPSASREQMIEEVGTMVTQLAKIVPAARQNGALQVNGSRPPQPSPFVPAGAGLAAAPQQPVENAWDALDPNRGD